MSFKCNQFRMYVILDYTSHSKKRRPVAGMSATLSVCQCFELSLNNLHPLNILPSTCLLTFPIPKAVWDE